MDNNNLSKLPMMALKDIPNPNADAKQIVALVKEEGRVVGYKLSDGQVLDKDESIKLAKQGGIRGVGIATRKGNEYLKSLPDESEGNNLSNLPSITKKWRCKAKGQNFFYKKSRPFTYQYLSIVNAARVISIIANIHSISQSHFFTWNHFKCSL